MQAVLWYLIILNGLRLLLHLGELAWEDFPIIDARGRGWTVLRVVMSAAVAAYCISLL